MAEVVCFPSQERLEKSEQNLVGETFLNEKVCGVFCPCVPSLMPQMTAGCHRPARNWKLWCCGFIGDSVVSENVKEEKFTLSVVLGSGDLTMSDTKSFVDCIPQPKQNIQTQDWLRAGSLFMELRNIIV